MNKKAQIMTSVSLKTYLIIILIFTLAIFLFIKLASYSPEKECPEGIIPDRFILTEYSEGRLLNRDRNINWADGTASYSFGCYSGEQEGENINYKYCKSISYHKEKINENIKFGEEIWLRRDLISETHDKNRLR